MSEEEKIKISVNEEDIQNLINCYKKDIEYIMQLEKENKKYKEVIDKAIEELKKGLHELDTRRREEVYAEEYIEESIDILKEVE